MRLNVLAFAALVFLVVGAVFIGFTGPTDPWHHAAAALLPAFGAGLGAMLTGYVLEKEHHANRVSAAQTGKEARTEARLIDGYARVTTSGNELAVLTRTEYGTIREIAQHLSASSDPTQPGTTRQGAVDKAHVMQEALNEKVYAISSMFSTERRIMELFAPPTVKVALDAYGQAFNALSGFLRHPEERHGKDVDQVQGLVDTLVARRNALGQALMDVVAAQRSA